MSRTASDLLPISAKACGSDRLPWDPSPKAGFIFGSPAATGQQQQEQSSCATPGAAERARSAPEGAQAPPGPFAPRLVVKGHRIQKGAELPPRCETRLTGPEEKARQPLGKEPSSFPRGCEPWLSRDTMRRAARHLIARPREADVDEEGGQQHLAAPLVVSVAHVLD